ncbi:MAG: alpha/beta hydrolase [Candidatus Eremiobacteraeota bacterium]|nr:alpha/beta hydrolase [Candidatus Eremiobacteraeota bacterium]
MKSFVTQFAIAFGLALTLSALPAIGQTPTHSFDVGSIHVDQYGSGDPALILIPGLTDSAAVWSGTIAHFAPQHTIYALTLGGTGGRPAPQGTLLDKTAADLAALITENNINKPVVIGHSMGGFLALHLAAEHSSLLRGAISLDGLPVLPGQENATPAQRASAASSMTGPMRGLTAAQLEAAERQMILPYMTQAKNLDAVAAAGRGADPAATAEYLQEMVQADLRPQLSNITVPLLVLMPFDASIDPQNPQTPFKTAAQKQQFYTGLLANARTAKLAVVNNSRHFIMYDQPEQFYALVQNFLGSL